MDVTLKLDGYDLSAMLSTYKTWQEITYPRTVTTLDNVEHPAPGVIRTMLEFSLLPITDVTATEIYNKLSQFLISVEYTNMAKGVDEIRMLCVMSNIEAEFMLKSIDGNRYYRGGTVQMRQL